MFHSTAQIFVGVYGLAVLGDGEVQMGLSGLRRRSGPHRADDLPGGHRVPGLHVGLGLEIGIGGLIAVVMLQHHGGAHQGIVRHRQHRPCGGRQYRGSLLGGDVHAGKNYIETLDPDISHVLRGFYFDKVFITVDGIDLERGYTVNNKNQIGLYTQLARMTRRFYILADSAKYDRRAFASAFPPEKTCRMITTSGAPQKYLDFYARQGIPCTVLPFE